MQYFNIINHYHYSVCISYFLLFSPFMNPFFPLSSSFASVFRPYFLSLLKFFFHCFLSSYSFSSLPFMFLLSSPSTICFFFHSRTIFSPSVSSLYLNTLFLYFPSFLSIPFPSICGLRAVMVIQGKHSGRQSKCQSKWSLPREREMRILLLIFTSLFSILLFIILLYSTSSHTVRNSPKRRGTTAAQKNTMILLVLCTQADIIQEEMCYTFTVFYFNCWISFLLC